MLVYAWQLLKVDRRVLDTQYVSRINTFFGTSTIGLFFSSAISQEYSSEI